MFNQRKLSGIRSPEININILFSVKQYFQVCFGSIIVIQKILVAALSELIDQIDSEEFEPLVEFINKPVSDAVRKVTPWMIKAFDQMLIHFLTVISDCKRAGIQEMVSIAHPSHQIQNQ